MLVECLIEFLATIIEIILEDRSKYILSVIVCLFCGSLLILSLIITVQSFVEDPKQSIQMGLVSLILAVALLLHIHSMIRNTKKDKE